MQPTCAGIILSGGLNTRMGGRDKARLELGGRSFIERILTAIDRFFKEFLLVTRQPELYQNLPVRIVEDIFNVRTPLTGIHAGLVNMDADYGFCTSCDIPFLKTDLVRMLVSSIDVHSDIVVPSVGTYFQPLCAVYSKRAIPYIEQSLTNGDIKTDRIYQKLRVKKVPYSSLQTVDPKLESFFNVNTPEDLQSANIILSRRKRLQK
jgi:molybdopterin-guanine dinucleotide biosynthesis protein A